MPQIVIQLPDVDIDDFDEDALNYFIDCAKPALRQAIQQWFEEQQAISADKIPFAVSFDKFVKLSVNILPYEQF